MTSILTVVLALVLVPPVAVTIEPVSARHLPEDLARDIPILLAAALESGEGYRTIPSAAGTEGAASTLRIQLQVSGKGPWRLAGRGTGSARLSTGKYTFEDRRDLIQAVDELAAALHAGIPDERRPAGTPLPLSRALSASTEAIEAWLAGRRALASGDGDEAVRRFSESTVLDPGFALAAADAIHLSLTAGAARAGLKLREGASGSPLALEVVGALETLLDGDADEALVRAESILARLPGLAWGNRLKGLALAGSGRHGEALPVWRALAAADPANPVPRAWIGRCLMAEGDFTGASESFEAARGGWPGLLDAWTLQAEAQARMGEPERSREILTRMRDLMRERGIAPESDARNPDLMLGSVELLLGHFDAAVDRFESAVEAAPGVAGTVHRILVESQIDQATSRDPITRDRQLVTARSTLERYEHSLSEEERKRRACELTRLRGLIVLKEGNTIEAWRIIEELRALGGDAEDEVYHEAYLAGATMLREGDDVGAVVELRRAAESRNDTRTLIDYARVMGRLRDYDTIRPVLETVGERLARYAPPMGTDLDGSDEMILTTPSLAVVVPVYHYERARLAFETGDAAASRRHFSRMLKYYQTADARVSGMINEAMGRGATPEW